MTRPMKRRAGDSDQLATQRLYLAADGTTVVGVGDVRAARLIATPGRPIPEIHLEAVAAFLAGSGAEEASPSAEGDTGDQGGQSDAFDPTKHRADDVVAYLKGLDLDTDEGKAEYERVLKAEEAGAARKTVLGGS